MEGPLCRLVEQRARRMQDMMQRLDVDPAMLVRMDAGQAYAEARARCLSCDTARECLFWLDASRELGGEPAFCANLDRFRNARRKQSTPEDDKS